MTTLKTLAANLRHGWSTNANAHIGGGIFSPTEPELP